MIYELKKYAFIYDWPIPYHGQAVNKVLMFRCDISGFSHIVVRLDIRRIWSMLVKPYIPCVKFPLLLHVLHNQKKRTPITTNFDNWREKKENWYHICQKHVCKIWFGDLPAVLLFLMFDSSIYSQYPVVRKVCFSMIGSFNTWWSKCADQSQEEYSKEKEEEEKACTSNHYPQSQKAERKKKKEREEKEKKRRKITNYHAPPSVPPSQWHLHHHCISPRPHTPQPWADTTTLSISYSPSSPARDLKQSHLL